MALNLFLWFCAVDSMDYLIIESQNLEAFYVKGLFSSDSNCQCYKIFTFIDPLYVGIQKIL
jgi:hypothetical protein